MKQLKKTLAMMTLTGCLGVNTLQADRPLAGQREDRPIPTRQVVELRHVTPDDLAESVKAEANYPAHLRRLPRGVSVTPLPGRNAVTLEGEAGAIALAIQVMAAWDKPMQNVEYEAMLVEVENDLVRQLGIDFVAFPSHTFMVNAKPGSAKPFVVQSNRKIVDPPFFVGRVRKSVQSTLQRLIEQKQAVIVSSARASTVNNLPASLTLKTQSPLFECLPGSSMPRGWGATSAMLTNRLAETTLHLRLRPRQKADRSLSSLIQLQTRHRVAPSQAPLNDIAPAQDSLTAQATLADESPILHTDFDTPDSSTIALGALMLRPMNLKVAPGLTAPPYRETLLLLTARLIDSNTPQTAP